MGFYDGIILGARIAQFVFAIIVLGTAAYAASQINSFYNNNFGVSIAFSQVNFIIFCAVWSLLVVGYQIFVPRFSEALGHKFIILGVDALTALFWFAGFIALSVFTSALSFDYGYVGYTAPGAWYHSLQAACAFGAFSWIAFMITTVLSALNVFRGNTGSAKHTHNPEIAVA